MPNRNERPPVPPSRYICEIDGVPYFIFDDGREVRVPPNRLHQFALACIAEVEWRKIYGLRLDRYMRNTDERSHGDTYKIDEAIENADAWRAWGEKENEG